MPRLRKLFENNRRWAAGMERTRPGFFRALTHQQAPDFLWIGCSDSRVPANEIVGLLPGELFVHRNVANLVVHSDMNCLSVLQYAVDVLKVRHVIVCGHYDCGGVKAAVEDRPHGLIDNWLGHVRDIERAHRRELGRLADPARRMDRLCELNVAGQVRSVASTSIVQAAWRRRQSLAVHGWIYAVSDGLLKDLGYSATAGGTTAGAPTAKRCLRPRK
jgi:carbonic anhydrase